MRPFRAALRSTISVMVNRRLPLTLPAELYEELERRAAAEDRDPLQQARRILREALANPAAEGAPS